jgi:hypothetical protein
VEQLVKLEDRISRKAMPPILLYAQEFDFGYYQGFRTSQSRYCSGFRDHQSPHDFHARSWEGAELRDPHLQYNAKKAGRELHFLEPSNGEARQHHFSNSASNES